MMTMGGRQVFIDTNILVYATIVGAPFHNQARQALQTSWDNEDTLWISRQILREYAMVVTRPQTFMQPLKSEVAIQQLQSFMTQFQIADDNAGVTTQWLNLIKTIGVNGKQVHDANIVATILAYNISHLLTHNMADFNRYGGLVNLIPLESGS